MCIVIFKKTTFLQQTFGSNGWEFECQHGPSECFGNKYQACALAQNYSQETNVKFVNCVMGSRSPAAFQTIYLVNLVIKIIPIYTLNLFQCAAQLDLSFEDINTCFNTNGDVVLAALGNKTHAVEPAITFVPTVIFNGKFDDDLQNLAQTNFKEALCSVIPVPKPAACTTKKNKLKFFFSHIPIFRSF